MGSYLKTIVLILVLIFLITFGVKNSQAVLLNYYFGVLDVGISLYELVYLSVVIGIVVGMIIGLQSRVSLGRKVKDLEREMKDLKEKLAEEAERSLLTTSQEGKAEAG